MTSLKVVPGRPRVADEVYDQLRTAILRKELAPSSRLSVPGLAQQLGVSRSPVREAVQRLVQDGLATERPRRGAVVTSIEPAALLSLYELRTVLEGLAARLACERAGKHELAELDRVQAAHRQAVENRDQQRHIELDLEFHAAIRKAARNSELASSLERIQGRVALAMLVSEESWWEQAVDEHAAILQALHEGSPTTAEVAAQAHISRIYQAIATLAGHTTNESNPT